MYGLINIFNILGSQPVSISNFWHGSKLLLSDDIPKIKEMKDKLSQYVYL